MTQLVTSYFKTIRITTIHKVEGHAILSLKMHLLICIWGCKIILKLRKYPGTNALLMITDVYADMRL